MTINLNDMDYSYIVNRNEKKIRATLDKFFQDANDDSLLQQLSQKDIQDVYALTLNKLPARYAHNTTIVIKDPISSSQIRTIIKQAIETVIKNPKP